MVRTERLELINAGGAQLQAAKYVSECMREQQILFPERSHEQQAAPTNQPPQPALPVFRLTHRNEVIKVIFQMDTA